MSYLEPRSHFRLPDPVRRLFGERETAAAARKPESGTSSWQKSVYSEVGDFLFDNQLDPTPNNYDLAYQFRIASNTQLVTAIRAEIEKTGALDADAAERIFAQSAGPVSADSLADFARKIEEQANGLNSIARQSGKDANQFRVALQEQCDKGVEPESILEITQSMVERTRVAEAQLREAEKELKGLRSNLVEAQRAADVDPLTELPNRRAFKRDLEAMIETARHDGTPISLAFCDIDHFKRFNDTFGHETGDRVLRYVAMHLSREFEQSGVVGRFGGEEFVVALPGLNLAKARKLVDNARADLCERNLKSQSDNSDLGTVSFSAGVTAMTDGDEVADLLRRADESLYKAKEGGRNCVVIG